MRSYRPCFEEQECTCTHTYTFTVLILCHSVSPKYTVCAPNPSLFLSLTPSSILSFHLYGHFPFFCLSSHFFILPSVSFSITSPILWLTFHSLYPPLLTHFPNISPPTHTHAHTQTRYFSIPPLALFQLTVDILYLAKCSVSFKLLYLALYILGSLFALASCLTRKVQTFWPKSNQIQTFWAFTFPRPFTNKKSFYSRIGK